jgi:hypothetical protein
MKIVSNQTLVMAKLRKNLPVKEKTTDVMKTKITK